jgi:cytochrome c
MDSFEFNKIVGAVLGVLLLVMVSGLVTEGIFSPSSAKVEGYALPGGEESAAAPAGETKTAAAETPIAVRLASADPAKGQAGIKACQACHNFEKGAGAKVGPALYGVVGRPKGSMAGFNYSAAFKELAGKGEKWDYASLDAFITNPKAYVAGTAMGYAGLPDGAKRAEIIAYLRTLSDNPEPLPQ